LVKDGKYKGKSVRNWAEKCPNGVEKGEDISRGTPRAVGSQEINRLQILRETKIRSGGVPAVVSVPKETEPRKYAKNLQSTAGKNPAIGLVNTKKSKKKRKERKQLHQKSIQEGRWEPSNVERAGIDGPQTSRNHGGG